MNCFETLNCHFELNAYTYCIYQGKLQAVVTGSWGKWYRGYSLWTVCDQPSGVWVIRTHEQCRYSTGPSLSSSNRTANGQSSRFAFSPRAPSSFLWPFFSRDLLLHPVQVILKSLQRTQRCPPNNSLPPSVPSSRAIPHTGESHTNKHFGSPAQSLTRMAGGPSHLYRWPKSTLPFWKMQIKFTARSDGNMSGTTHMSVSCLVHGFSIFKPSEKQSQWIDGKWIKVDFLYLCQINYKWAAK